MNENLDFHEYLRNRRKELKLSIRDLSRITGISHTHISQLENRLRGIPTLDVLSKLALGLKVPKASLIALIWRDDIKVSVFSKLLKLSTYDLSKVDEFIDLLLDEKGDLNS
jgi:transcriptional regulator with XRE-family HTH domain